MLIIHVVDVTIIFTEIYQLKFKYSPITFHQQINTLINFVLPYPIKCNFSNYTLL